MRKRIGLVGLVALVVAVIGNACVLEPFFLHERQVCRWVTYQKSSIELICPELAEECKKQESETSPHRCAFSTSEDKCGKGIVRPIEDGKWVDICDPRRGLYCAADDRCQKKECETVSDCKDSWKACSGFACIPKSCKVDQDCAADGIVCLSGFCAPKPPTPECIAGQTRQCYSGPPGTQGVGVCKVGTQSCKDGKWETTCTGEVKPQPETCDGADNDCNGKIDEIDACQKGECKDGEERPCGSAAVGICKPGKQVCSGKQWGACQGGIDPQPQEICDNKLDDNCNGQADEGCETKSETWALALGATSPRVAVSGKNTVVVATKRSGSIKGKSDVLVVKLDSNRKEILRVQLGGGGDEVATSVAVSASGDIFITGYYSGQAQFGQINLTSSGSNDGFIVKLDNGGKVVWAISFGGGNSNDVPRAITLTSKGDLYLTGQFNGPAIFGSEALTPQGEDVFVSKVSSSSGRFTWTKKAGGASTDDANALTVDSAGNVYVTGVYRARASFGSVQLYTEFGYDSFVAKLDSQGQFLWTKGSTSSKDALGQGIAVDASGNVFVAGSFQESADFGGKKVTSKGAYDIFLAKFSKDGILDYVKSYGASNDERLQGIAISGSKLALTGYFAANTDIGGQKLSGKGLEAFVATVDASGSVLKAFSGGGDGADTGIRAAWDGSFLVAVGEFNFVGTFGGQKVTSQSAIETFVWRLQP